MTPRACRVLAHIRIMHEERLAVKKTEKDPGDPVDFSP